MKDFPKNISLFDSKYVEKHGKELKRGLQKGNKIKLSKVREKNWREKERQGEKGRERERERERDR